MSVTSNIKTVNKAIYALNKKYKFHKNNIFIQISAMKIINNFLTKANFYKFEIDKFIFTFFVNFEPESEYFVEYKQKNYKIEKILSVLLNDEY
jgi:hypothetical protein